MAEEKQVKAITKGKAQSLPSPRWLLHHHTGYLFPEQQQVSVFSGAASGSWFSVNCQTRSSKEIITEDVFKLWIEHGKENTEKSYAYIVVPQTNRQQMEQYAATSPVKIRYNHRDLQLVEHPEARILYAVCYQPMQITHPILGKISMDKAGILFLKYDKQGY